MPKPIRRCQLEEVTGYFVRDALGLCDIVTGRYLLSLSGDGRRVLRKLRERKGKRAGQLSQAHEENLLRFADHAR